MKKETLIIGDIHGCIEELHLLLKLVSFSPEKMDLIFVGDLGDRGFYSIETVLFIKELCEKNAAKCVMGNHENKHIRKRNHDIRFSLTGKPNPMKPLSVLDLEFHKKLSDNDIDWMRKLPLTVQVKDDLFVIHGGLEPAYSFAEQSPEQIIRCRYVSSKGKAIPLNKDRSQPKGTTYWADSWNGKESIVFGHNVFDNPTIFKNKNNTCIGIDTGCVYGGFLTGYFVEKNEFVKIKAKREYYVKKNSLDDL